MKSKCFFRPRLGVFGGVQNHDPIHSSTVPLDGSQGNHRGLQLPGRSHAYIVFKVLLTLRGLCFSLASTVVDCLNTYLHFSNVVSHAIDCGKAAGAAFALQYMRTRRPEQTNPSKEAVQTITNAVRRLLSLLSQICFKIHYNYIFYDDCFRLSRYEMNQ